MSVYYATKAYVLSFSEGLREELTGTGVNVTCLAPGPTETGFGEDSGMGKLSFFAKATMSAEEVAKAGYAGFLNNEAVVIPGWQNRITVVASRLLPRVATRKMVAKMQRS